MGLYFYRPPQEDVKRRKPDRRPKRRALVETRDRPEGHFSDSCRGQNDIGLAPVEDRMILACPPPRFTRRRREVYVRHAEPTRRLQPEGE